MWSRQDLACTAVCLSVRKSVRRDTKAIAVRYYRANVRRDSSKRRLHADGDLVLHRCWRRCFNSHGLRMNKGKEGAGYFRNTGLEHFAQRADIGRASAADVEQHFNHGAL